MSKLHRSSLHDLEGWRSQYNRMLRWHQRFLQDHDGDEDVMFAFFQNCYILKDWLLHDEVISQADYDEFIRKNNCISMCRDVCNGTKHGQLDPKDGKRNPRNPIVGREYSGRADSFSFYLVVDFQKCDAKALAEQCVEAWNDLLFKKIESNVDS